MYSLLRQLLFAMDPERSHDLALAGMRALGAVGLARLLRAAGDLHDPVQLLGLTFPNRIGLAAGLDKNGDYLAALGQLGFGFIEVGTVTPRPQPGNPAPRLFRLPRQRALINRMGFNNKGVDHLVGRVRDSRYRGIVGINIGKNRDTPLERAVDDYLFCLRRVYEVADYVTVNISSPNTPGLRDLQQGRQFADLLDALALERKRLTVRYDRRVPLLVKIAPDIAPEGIQAFGEALAASGVDGVIATNTTLERPGLAGVVGASEAGGLSGAPLMPLSTGVLRELRRVLAPDVPLVGVGGVLSGDDAAAKARAGADLVQLYTGLIYRGPALIGECVSALRQVARYAAH